LKKIISRDPQRIDLGVVDGPAQFLMVRFEEIAFKIDLDKRHKNLPYT
jgi:hypothetical protein